MNKNDYAHFRNILRRDPSNLTREDVLFLQDKVQEQHEKLEQIKQQLQDCEGDTDNFFLWLAGELKVTLTWHESDWWEDE